MATTSQGVSELFKGGRAKRQKVKPKQTLLVFSQRTDSFTLRKAPKRK